MALNKANSTTEQNTYQEAGTALASMYGSMAPEELSHFFTVLFPSYSNGQDWESFKLAYMAGLWKNAEELASPVFVADTNPDEHRATDAVGFMTLAYVSSGDGELELLDRDTEIM